MINTLQFVTIKIFFFFTLAFVHPFFLLAIIPLSQILFVLPYLLFVFTGVHLCSTCIYACVLLVLVCVLIVFTGIHSCLPVLTGVLRRVLLQDRSKKVQYSAGIYSFKVNIVNTRTMCQNDVSGVVLVSLLLTLSRFHTLSKCFHY